LASLRRVVLILMDDEEPSTANTDERTDRKSEEAEDNDIVMIDQVTSDG